jgi:ubiquinone/menaquinone biosynthesis C-methylase UbiE
MVEVVRAAIGAQPFDAAAADYDAAFSENLCGRALRESVWRRLGPHIHPGMRALDLGCGTGEDALFLARQGCTVTAVDSAPAMLNVAAAKIARAELGARIRLSALDFNLPDAEFGGPFDFVLSDFGAVNCVRDIAAFGEKLARCLRPGGIAAIVFMGRFCALETLYYLRRFDARAGRRWRGKALAKVGARSISIRYWTVGEIKRSLVRFKAIRACGIGVLIPPSYLFHLAHGRPKLFAGLARWDRKVSPVWPLSRMGDHTLLLLERKDA